MSRNVWTYENAFQGLAESTITSNVLDLRDAFDFTISYRTTAGSVSTFTYQFSNGSNKATLPEEGWSDWTTHVVNSGASFFQPPLGFAYARILRAASTASLEFNTFKQIR
jgi:hypothetical protein